jgi:hypothetical protein
VRLSQSTAITAARCSNRLVFVMQTEYLLEVQVEMLKHVAGDTLIAGFNVFVVTAKYGKCSKSAGFGRTEL